MFEEGQMSEVFTAPALVSLMRAEYLEMPGLCLTQAQMQRLWGVDPSTCAAAVNALVAAHVLRRTDRNAYVRATREY